jgi:hypothetical protein
VFCHDDHVGKIAVTGLITVGPLPFMAMHAVLPPFSAFPTPCGFRFFLLRQRLFGLGFAFASIVKISGLESFSALWVWGVENA